MKKNILIIFLLTQNLFVLGQINAKNDLARIDHKGKTKSITQHYYRVVEKFGEAEKDKFMFSSKTIYDTNGNESESVVYDSDGNIQIIAGKTSEYIFKSSYKDNKRIRDTYYKNDSNLEEKQVFIYDDKGLEIEWNNYYGDGRLSDKIKTKYELNQIERSHYSEDGVLEEKTNAQYDNRGNIETKYYYKPNGDLKSKNTYKYEKFDKIGNWLKKVEYIDDKPTLIIEQVIQYY